MAITMTAVSVPDVNQLVLVIFTRIQSNLIFTFAQNVFEGLKQEGEDCGECYCPPTYNAGTCAPGLICKYDDMIPDAAGTCVKPGKM